MKKIYWLILFYGLNLTPVTAQVYQGENKVFLNLETFSEGLLKFESDKLSVEINQEQNQINFSVDFESFHSLDSTKLSPLFEALFQDEEYTVISYKGAFPAAKFDPQSDRMQPIDLNGTLIIGNLKIDTPLKLELRLMDRFLFFDFDLVLLFNKIGIEIPETYSKRLTGILHLEVLNGKLISGFR